MSPMRNSSKRAKVAVSSHSNLPDGRKPFQVAEPSLHEDTTSRLDKLFNFMKISEMSRYGSDTVFERALELHMAMLEEKDFRTLIISYWCCVSHFKAIVSRRGRPILNGRLELPLTLDLLSQAVSEIAVEKIKAMLLVRDTDENATPERRAEMNKEFLLRSTRLPRRFWDIQVPIQAFAELGWLTEDFASLGMERFAKYMRSRVSSPISMQGLRNGHSTDVNATNSQGEPAYNALPHMVPGDRHPPAENPRKRQRTIINKKILGKWAELADLLASKGAVINDEDLTDLPDLVFDAFIGGQNTRALKLMDLESKNDLLFESLGLRVPRDIWTSLIEFF